jgi:hypothetical protein
MRDGTLARQISPVFLADAPGAVRVDGLHRSHVVQGLISQGLSRHTHTLECGFPTVAWDSDVHK